MWSQYPAGVYNHATVATEKERAKIINRLKRLEGQVRGLQNMVEEERSCREILTLLAGVRKALDATGDVILEQYLNQCGNELNNGDLDIATIVSAVKLTRR